MLEAFKPYYKTVRNFLKYRNKKAYELFKEENLSENYDHHDNWNGGIDYYTIVLKVSVAQYVEIEGEVEGKITEDITKAFENAIRNDESLQINGTMVVPHDDETTFTPTSESMWNMDYFRLFISHISENKTSAKNLKECLEKWGIQGFVAHEDIEPTKEWISVLYDALFSMDALCAILVKKFRFSSWCDQEIGIALGRNKLCIPINKDIIPYGFLGRYQMIKANGQDANHVAQKVAESIFENNRTHGIYCNNLIRLLINAKTIDKAINWINIINYFSKMEKVYIEMIHKEYSHNAILLAPDVLDQMNALFKRYGMAKALFPLRDNVNDNTDELPF